jgi:hypothetical protein
MCVCANVWEATGMVQSINLICESRLPYHSFGYVRDVTVYRVVKGISSIESAIVDNKEAIQ